MEKILKAHYVKDNEDYPPKIHDLINLSKRIKIDKDVNEYFKSSEEVNNALRAIIIAIPKTRRKTAQTV